MAWSDLLSNQEVSFTDAQTSGFPLKAGQSHSTSNQCMTKSEIVAKYTVNIGTAYASSYTDSQLVPVTDWLPKGTGISLCYHVDSIETACLLCNVLT